MAANVWSRDSWYTEIVGFRRDPLGYLNINKIEEENFHHDILLALVDEDVHSNAKIQLLGILEEYSSQLLTSTASLEYAVASLLNIYKQSANTASLFSRQILVTVTSLLIIRDFKDEGESLFCQFVEQLLDVVVDTKKVSRHLRATACYCLKELENTWPGLLLRKLEYFYQLCQMESSPAVQGYILLFSCTLANAVAVSLFEEQRIPNSHLTDLLCNRTEPLKPFVLPKILSSFMEKTKTSSMDGLSKDMDTRELQRAVSFLVDHTYLLTTPALATVYRHLIDIVKWTPQIAPVIFKGAVLRYSHTLNAPLLQVILAMKQTFGDALLQGDDTQSLVQSMLLALSHPSLPTEQRLLMAEWLKHIPSKKGVVSTAPSLPYLHDAHQYAIYFPLPSDKVDSQIKKLHLLSLAVENLDDEDVLAGTLLKGLSGLHKYMQYGVEGRVADAFFHLLFIFYSRHNHHTSLVQRIESVLVDLVGCHPKYTPQVLDFIEAIETIQGSRAVITSLLLAVMTSMTSDPRLSSGDIDLKHHLVVLQRIAQETSIVPQKVLLNLNQLMEQADLCNQGDWLLGNLILGICRRVMQFHNTQKVFMDLADLLHTVGNNYQDVDIQDRAKFYYAMLTVLSSEKASSLLTAKSTEDKSSQGLAGIVSGNTHFSGRVTVAHLERPVISLTRISPESVPVAKVVTENEDKPTETDVLSLYEKHWQNDESLGWIQLHYNVQLISDDADLDEVYALVIEFETPPFYEPIQDVSVPLLEKCNENELHIEKIHIKLEPCQPVPCKIKARAVFMCKSGTTFTCPVDDLQVTMDDLCQPLPCPSHVGSPQGLFSSLWEAYTADDKENTAVQSVCVLHLDPKEIPNLINDRWKNYVIQESEQGKAYDIAMFLPPSHHLLLRIKGQGQKTVVSLAADDLQLLPLVSSYLKQFET